MIIPKDWRIIERSNVVQFDNMGYPLRLFIIEEKNKGLFGTISTEIRQVWIDVDDFNDSEDVVCTWRCKDEKR